MVKHWIYLWLLGGIFIGLPSCNEAENKAPQEKFVANMDLDGKFISNWYLHSGYSTIPDSIMKRLYMTNGYEAIWYTDSVLLPTTDLLFLNISQELLFGFDTAGYQLRGMMAFADSNQIIRSLEQQEQALVFDIKMSGLYLDMLSFKTGGVVDTVLDSLRWLIRPDSLDLVSFLDSIFEEKIHHKSIPVYEPDHPQYSELRKAYEELSKRSLEMKWDTIFFSEKIEPGKSSNDIPSIRDRLIIWGDLDTVGYAYTDSLLFDKPLIKAVKYFQRRHNLYPDGIIGQRTLNALNASPSDRMEQILINIERYKWIPIKTPKPHIWVNIPEYKATIIETDSIALEMNTVIGKEKTPTPIFMDEMEYLVMSPFWNIPQSISGKEIWPQLLDSTTYLRENHMEVKIEGELVHPDSVDWRKVSYKDFKHKIRIRQTPGIFNSLGTIKFIFPNRHWVYLHDTNSKNIFSYSKRSRSHGCVRISKPIEFAEYLLHDQEDWTVDSINTARLGGEQIQVNLKEKIPIYIVYYTAKVEDDGTLRFFEDIYGYDKALKPMIKRH